MDLQSLNETRALEQGPMLQNYGSQKRVILTDEIQFNHKPAKMLLAEKRRDSAKMPKPQI